MTATDELLTLLKEQGFEHYRHEVHAEKDCVAFYDGNRWHDCWESVDGDVNVTFSMTPEQAIAATVGCGTCEADETETIKCWVKCKDEPSTEHMELIHVMECSECGHTYEYVNGDYEFCPRCGRRRMDA